MLVRARSVTLLCFIYRICLKLMENFCDTNSFQRDPRVCIRGDRSSSARNPLRVEFSSCTRGGAGVRSGGAPWCGPATGCRLAEMQSRRRRLQPTVAWWLASRRLARSRPLLPANRRQNQNTGFEPPGTSKHEFSISQTHTTELRIMQCAVGGS